MSEKSQENSKIRKTELSPNIVSSSPLLSNSQAFDPQEEISQSPESKTEWLVKFIDETDTRILRLARDYAWDYFGKEDLLEDMKILLKNKPDLSLERIEEIIYDRLNRRVKEFAWLKEIIADFIMKAFGKDEYSEEYDFFDKFFKSTLDDLFKGNLSSDPLIFFKKLQEDKDYKPSVYKKST